MKGKLFGVGIGPGDPELLTLKAVDKLIEAQCIIAPKSCEDKESLALSIISDVIGNKEKNIHADTLKKEVIELVFPMSRDNETLENAWQKAAGFIKSKLDEGIDVAFATLGDPSVYSTYMYIHKKLVNDGYEAHIIPGVSSFCACCAAAGISLAEKNEKIAIIPLNDFENESDCIDTIIDKFENVVFMKAGKSISKISDKLKEKNLFDKAVIVDRCGMMQESLHYDLQAAVKNDFSYFSTMIVKKNGVK